MGRHLARGARRVFSIRLGELELEELEAAARLAFATERPSLGDYVRAVALERARADIAAAKRAAAERAELERLNRSQITIEQVIAGAASPSSSPKRSTSILEAPAASSPTPPPRATAPLPYWGPGRKFPPDATLETPCAKCGRPFGEHAGQKCPPAARVAAARVAAPSSSSSPRSSRSSGPEIAARMDRRAIALLEWRRVSRRWKAELLGAATAPAFRADLEALEPGVTLRNRKIGEVIVSPEKNARLARTGRFVATWIPSRPSRLGPRRTLAVADTADGARAGAGMVLVRVGVLEERKP
jgi:hypothetical protein